jgi:hexosaminidase
MTIRSKRSSLFRHAIAGAFLSLCAGKAFAGGPSDLIPQPASIQVKPDCALRWNRTPLPRLDSTAFPALALRTQDDPELPAEAYRIRIDASGVSLEAGSADGYRNAYATLHQLHEPGRGFSCVTIDDKPRFPWRGLSLDVARHFMPVNSVRKLLFDMAAIKLNVLHLHLTDDQGFRIESKRLPLLHLKGSEGSFYTQAEMKGLIGYAQTVGIRIVPEFDVPGHATAWLAGYPEIGSAPGEYQPDPRVITQDASLDPTNERTYAILDQFLGEMAALFPDPYFHLGGDEVTGKHWDANPAITKFKKDRGFTSNHQLQVHFMQRVHQIAAKHGKKLVLWDEALDPSLPPGITYQAWRGPYALLATAFASRPALVSYDFYLDWGLPAERSYGNQLDGAPPDPTDHILKRLATIIRYPAERPRGLLLTDREKTFVQGGEACLFTEFTTPRNLELRLWPRLGAIAERLWSPATTVDTDSLYRRLAVLEERLTGDIYRGEFPDDATRTFTETIEPGRYVYRHLSRKYTVKSDMTRLVDLIRPESIAARNFRVDVENKRWAEVRAALKKWEAAAVLAKYPEAPVADVQTILRIANESLGAIDGTVRLASGWKQKSLDTCDAMLDNKREIVVAIARGVRVLVEQVR